MTNDKPDLLDRIRSLRYVHVPQASQLFEEAIAEIERLRALADNRGEIAVNRRREIERLRLTDAEREAIAGAIEAEHGRGSWRWADTLRTLLERLA